jgi:hypothetical protein
MLTSRVVPAALILSAAALAQSADTGTAHKAAATALFDANNIGAAHLACPAYISAELTTSFPPGGGPPSQDGATRPFRSSADYAAKR